MQPRPREDSIGHVTDNAGTLGTFLFQASPANFTSYLGLARYRATDSNTTSPPIFVPRSMGILFVQIWSQYGIVQSCSKDMGGVRARPPPVHSTCKRNLPWIG